MAIAPRKRTWRLVVLAVALATTASLPSRAETVRNDGTSGRSDTVAGAGISLPRSLVLTPVEWDALYLGLAVDAWSMGDQRRAVELLQEIDISPTSPFPEADRAAFLLAVASLELGDVEGFHSVAARADGDSDSPYRRWIRYCLLLESGRGGYLEDIVTRPGPSDAPGAGILAAALLLEAGRPADAARILDQAKTPKELQSIHIYLRALTAEADGSDATRDWRELARRKPHAHLEAELVALANLRLAQLQIENGDDPGEALARVGSDSPHAQRARHIAALRTLESGDTAAAEQMLSRILVEHPGYDLAREIEVELGALQMDRERWRAALAAFESSDAAWRREYESLGLLEADSSAARAWQAWERQQRWREEVRLAPEALLERFDELARESLDLRESPSLDNDGSLAKTLWPVAGEARNGDLPPAVVHTAPSPEEWQALRSLQQQRRHAAGVLARQEREVERRQEDIERHIAYLTGGFDRALVSAVDLSRAAARLGEILARMDSAVFQLEAARDTALLDIATRTRTMAVEIRRELLFVEAVRHFHVEGPNLDRPEEFPEGIPSPAELLGHEAELAREVTAFLDFFAAHYPDVIARSFDELWEPRLTGDSRWLHAALLAELERARGIGVAIDSTIGWHAADPALVEAMARRDELAAAVDSLDRAETDLRRDIAFAVAARGRERLAAAREAIDYHLADASYELAVAASTDTATAEDIALVAPLRASAVARLDTFLARYPQSFARGETRFRLADMRLMQARDDFQAEMARYLGENPESKDLNDRALAPFVDYAPAIALYEAILTEDTEFPHMDAVLFNLGMILSDDGRPEAADYLTRLVEEYPQSPNCQEAWLRMGNDRFDREDYAGCLPYFEKAVAGADRAFTAIALYKLGWARFEQDRFRGSADAFRRLIDLYAEHEDIAAAMDLREEAEEYLVHSLARSGGARAFRQYFDDLGERPYESDVLLALGHLMRSVSLYDEAIACDELWVERYPLDPRALDAASRLVTTYRRWNKPDAARAARLSYAEHFLGGSDWFEANGDPALRARGQAFAQSAFRENAAFYHKSARENDKPESWRAALSSYERYLQQWPAARDADRMHLLAGETAGHIAAYGVALDHYHAASTSDSTALARDASWRHVAVSDEWYRTSQPAPDANGADSLAVRLLASGRDFVARFPDDERGADIAWRQGNVAYAHGWYEQAAASFSDLGRRFPADPRAARAARMSGDARYRLAEYDAAGAAYETALGLARAAGEDSVVATLEAAIPLCYFKHAENVAAADTARGVQKAAPLFAGVARRWPGFEHADLALYRAGLGFAAAGSTADATAAWEQLLASHPESEYARDSAVQIALVYEKSGSPRSAAAAWERFSRKYPSDPDAAEALLKSADLLAAAGDERAAEEARTRFLQRFPGETDAVMEIRAGRARRELARVSAGDASIASLMGAAAGGGGASDLQAYVDLARQNPELASPTILAQVDFLRAEEALPGYTAMRLTQPLPPSIEKKKAKLEEVLSLYNECATHGIAEYARASAYRIGEVLIAFGDALVASERPDDLSEDDLVAYDDVLTEQSWEFYDRGEDVWSELLRQLGDAEDDPGDWIARTRAALWPRLAQRFMHRPEVDYPLVAATPPAPREAQ